MDSGMTDFPSCCLAYIFRSVCSEKSYLSYICIPSGHLLHKMSEPFRFPYRISVTQLVIVCPG